MGGGATGGGCAIDAGSKRGLPLANGSEAINGSGGIRSGKSDIFAREEGDIAGELTPGATGTSGDRKLNPH